MCNVLAENGMQATQEIEFPRWLILVNASRSSRSCLGFHGE